MKTWILIGLLVFLVGCTASNGIACTAEAKVCPDGSAVGREGPLCEFAPCPDLEEGAFSVSDVISNADSLVGSTILVKGSFGAMACTEMACIPEQACCNSCYAEFYDLDDPDLSIAVSGQDCAFPRSRMGSRNVEIEGTWTRQGDNYVLVLDNPMVPIEPEIFIKKFDSPGIAVNLSYVTTTIYEGGEVIIETEETGYDEENAISAKLKQLSEEQLQDLEDLILSTNFFDLTEEQTRSCIIDSRTTELEINISGESKTISEIGAQCDMDVMAGTLEIIEKIEELLE